MDDALHIPGLRAEGCSAHLVGRLFAGELHGEGEAKARGHVEGCRRCTETLATLTREQQLFQAELPLEKFIAGVSAKRVAPPKRSAIVPAVMALAACFAVVLLAKPLFLSGTPHNLTKGGAAMELYVGGNGAAPRLAHDGEALARGERVRVGYTATDKQYVAVVSIDEQGKVSALYPEKGQSLPVEPGSGPHLLPESVEFDGRGFERVVTVFSDAPLAVDQIVEAARSAFDRASGVEQMGPLGLPSVEESTRLVQKN